jgi:hypothetical protein
MLVAVQSRNASLQIVVLGPRPSGHNLSVSMTADHDHHKLLLEHSSPSYEMYDRIDLPTTPLLSASSLSTIIASMFTISSNSNPSASVVNHVRTTVLGLLRDLVRDNSTTLFDLLSLLQSCADACASHTLSLVTSSGEINRTTYSVVLGHSQT